MDKLDPVLKRRLWQLVSAVSAAPISATTVRSPGQAWNLHILDSLSGLVAPEVSEAPRISDIGSGAGFPGLVLALALPNSHVTLVESVDKKVRLIERVARDVGIDNVSTVTARAEEWSATGVEGRESSDTVVVRALAPLPVLLEYASPLLKVGGFLVAWKGRRDPNEESAGAEAGRLTGMVLCRVQPIEPLPGAQERNLHVYEKTSPTPPGLPRRPGMALKRPLIKK